MNYLVSSLYVKGLASATEQVAMTSVFETLSPEARAMFREPHAVAWWPGHLVEEFGASVLALFGEERTVLLGAKVVSLAVAAISRPLVTLASTLNPHDPAALLKHFGQFSSSAVRNVGFEFKLLAPGRGVQTITYPHATAPRSNGLFWRGGLQRTLERSGAANTRVGEMRHQGGAFEFDVTWDA